MPASLAQYICTPPNTDLLTSVSSTLSHRMALAALEQVCRSSRLSRGLCCTALSRICPAKSVWIRKPPSAPVPSLAPRAALFTCWSRLSSTWLLRKSEMAFSCSPRVAKGLGASFPPSLGLPSPSCSTPS